jgi:hypothetical protein
MLRTSVVSSGGIDSATPTPTDIVGGTLNNISTPFDFTKSIAQRKITLDLQSKRAAHTRQQ